VVLTTLAVSVLPILAVSALHSQGLIGGLIPLVGAGLAISFAITVAGSAIWKTTPWSGDMLFGDLIIWGFIRRWRVDRRMSNAADLLGMRGGRVAGGLSPERKAELLEELSNSLEALDPYTHGHSRRVARHSAVMAKRLGLSHREVARIRTAAAIHDVGKVETPKAVLGKPGPLDDEEFEVIKRHPVDGARMVAALKDPKLTKMVLHHHERLDGGGYPEGLAGEDIPLGSRIIAVADTFDAITSARPYRPAKAHRNALDVLRAESGTQLDSDAVEAFRSYYSGLRPVAIWAVLVSIPQRLFTGLFDDLGASVASASKMAVATTASVIAGAAAVHAVSTVSPPSSEGDRGQAESLALAPEGDGLPTFAAFPSLPGRAPLQHGASGASNPSGGSAGAAAEVKGKGTLGADSPGWTNAQPPGSAGDPGGTSAGNGGETSGGDTERTTGQPQPATDGGPSQPGTSGGASTEQTEPTTPVTAGEKPKGGSGGKSKGSKGKSGEHPSSGKGNSGEHPSSGKGNSGEQPSSGKSNSGENSNGGSGGSQGAGHGGGNPQGGRTSGGGSGSPGGPASAPPSSGKSSAGGGSPTGSASGSGGPPSAASSGTAPSGGEDKPH
jgi:hypothetical protein